MLAGISGVAQRATDMVEDDRGGGKGVGKLGNLAKLRMVEPGVEGEPAPGKLGEALAPGLVPGELRRRVGARIADAGIGIPAGLVADALETAVAGGDLGIEHRARFRSHAQIDVAHDAHAGAQIAVDAAGAHRRHAIGELGLADATQLGRPLLAVHRMAVDEDGADDVVTGLSVGQQVVEHVIVAGALPEMMVWIDDWQPRLERRLRELGDPRGIRGDDVAECRGLCRHGFLPL